MPTKEEMLSAAWGSIGRGLDQTGVAYNPAAAFVAAAIALKLGPPTGNEYRYGSTSGQPAGAGRRAGQCFRDAFLDCVEGDWANAKAYDLLTAEPYVPPVPPPPGTIVPPSDFIPFDASKAVAPGYFEQGSPLAGKPFFRAVSETVVQGVGAYCYVTVLDTKGGGILGAKVVNQWLGSSNGECVLTDGTGVARFQFGTGASVPDPNTGRYPFSFAVTLDGYKDNDAKILHVGTIISDWARGIGDYDAEHTQINIQFRQIQ